MENLLKQLQPKSKEKEVSKREKPAPVRVPEAEIDYTEIDNLLEEYKDHVPSKKGDDGDVLITQTQAWLCYELIYKKPRQDRKRKAWYVKKIKEALG